MSENQPQVENVEQPSKAALKKAAKEAAKAEKKAAIAANQPGPYMPPKLEIPTMAEAIFGDMPLHMSQEEFKAGLEYTPLKEISTNPQEGEIRVRGYLQTVRTTGKGAFATIRQGSENLQCVHFGNKELIKYVNSVPKESFVEVWGKLVKPEQQIVSCTITNVELQVDKFFAITRAPQQLPLQVEDAARPDSAFTKADCQYVNPGRETRLDNRILDLRTPANQAIFRVRAAIQQAFTAFMVKEGFLQITSPKLTAGSSEGGANVFTLKYFEQSACLAQSPQLFKQMSIAAGFGRVFEIGPVFRAENSHTHRHLCEFTGLDLEMEILKDYHEVLTVLDRLMKHIFSTVLAQCESEIKTIRAQYDLKMPAPLVWTDSPVIVDFREGARWIREAGMDQPDNEDLSTATERKLGEIVKEKFGTDFYILDKFPASVRPFYTMPDSKDPNFSNSYDMFIRGEEICSGAQRIHDPDFLRQKIIEKGIDPETLADYIAAFRFGCPPHGGAGLGLERIVMLMLGIEDCRQCCLFPRTPERLTP